MDSQCLQPGKSGNPGLADSGGYCLGIFTQGFPREVLGHHLHNFATFIYIPWTEQLHVFLYIIQHLKKNIFFSLLSVKPHCFEVLLSSHMH